MVASAAVVGVSVPRRNAKGDEAQDWEVEEQHDKHYPLERSC